MNDRPWQVSWLAGHRALLPSPKPSDKKAVCYPLTVAGAAADLISEPLGLLSHCVPYYPREGHHRRGLSLTRVSFQIKLGGRGYQLYGTADEIE